jgi:tRNA A-37 threonylcarbamoyl transferase component Bud32
VLLRRVFQVTLSLEKLTREMGLRIIERFPSKKNHVYLVAGIKDGSYAVLKVYDIATRDFLVVEKKVLIQAYQRGVAVPAIISCWEDKALLMEFIKGSNACDVVNQTRDMDIAHGLGKWLAQFHLAFKGKGKSLIKGDTILRNFVVGEIPKAKIYGVDFEESRYGDPVSDLGKLCASILDTNPAFTPWKFSYCLRLVEEYAGVYGPVDQRVLEREIAVSLKETATRRPSQREQLLSEAKHILDCGLERG